MERSQRERTERRRGLDEGSEEKEAKKQIVRTFILNVELLPSTHLFDQSNNQNVAIARWNLIYAFTIEKVEED